MQMSFDCDGKESVPIVLEGKIEKNCARAQCSVHSMTWKTKSTKNKRKIAMVKFFGFHFFLCSNRMHTNVKILTHKKNHIRERDERTKAMKGVRLSSAEACQQPVNLCAWCSSVSVSVFVGKKFSPSQEHRMWNG